MTSPKLEMAAASVRTEAQMRDLHLIEGAYNSVLRLSHGAARARLQPVLARLRDEIALQRDMDSETVQNIFEYHNGLPRSGGKVIG